MPASTFEQLQHHQRDAILALAGKHGIRDVRVFGSVARGDDTPDSDIDFLIDLEEGRGLNDWANFHIEMERLLAPRKVDVWPQHNLKKLFLADVMKQAKQL